jgi:hypothetical protein
MTAKKTNWKAIIEKQNAETYRLPDGWDSRETIAELLDCSPERVAEHLRPGMKAGTVERKIFPVWDSHNKRVMQVTAYRQSTPAPAKK